MMMKGNYRPGCQYAQTEDRKFCELFGCGPRDAASAWRKMEANDGLVVGGRVYYMLWALLLMKKYTTEQVLCQIAGGVDEKTFRKWTWPFITAIADLEGDVVSSQCDFVLSYLIF
jgi:hypothetical protein